jgi:hypothetical protein
MMARDPRHALPALEGGSACRNKSSLGAARAAKLD